MTNTCHLLVLSATLGCAAPSAGAAQEGDAAAAPADDPGPIRFGDPEGLAPDEPYFPGATYEESVPTADSFLGQEHGTRLAHHAEILAAFRTWADTSPRLTLESYGATHEGRELVYAVITSQENHARLDEIRADLGRLHDPRETDPGAGLAIVRASPAVAWLGYSIHGDELSGADASMAVAYHLIASTDDDVAEVLRNVVVVMDPCMNPDGRERIISMVEQSAGKTPNYDYASMQRGRWPFGRGNHYLFDMNRDWMAGTQPETRGRWRVARAFHPQLFVDAHEMSSLDTFLTYPQNTPLNPYLPENLAQWQRQYALGAAAAFDAHGWSYYTREWADAWAPFYSDAWGSLAGATGILYEQASTSGFPLRRASGELLTYREAVHHQVAASMANVTTLSQNRQSVLADYLEGKRRNVDGETPGNDRAFVVAPDRNRDRIDALVRMLLEQGIEIFQVGQAFEARNVVGHLGESSETKELPAGSLVIPARQPMGPMVRAYLEFDVRMPKEDLQKEREEIERKGETRIYDLTSWSLPYALDLESYWCDVPRVAMEPLDAPGPRSAVAQGILPCVAWVVPGKDDASVAFAAQAMEAGLRVHVSDEPFIVTLSRDREPLRLEAPAGSLVVRAVENAGTADEVEARVVEAANRAGADAVWRADTGLAREDGPDLGGGHFHLLARPRVAVLTNAPLAPESYGHLWHHLDRTVGVPFSLLDAQAFAGTDLRRYNVLVLPPGNLDSLLEKNKEALETWIEGGGTLIACGSSAAALTAGRAGLSAVTLRRDALENLTPYRLAASYDRSARSIEIDEAAVWGDEIEPAASAEDANEEDDDPYEAEKISKLHDEHLRRFSPYGVTLRGIVDPESWITSGARAELPVLFTGANVFLSKAPVRTAVRLAAQERLRLGGLVWPEARERIAESAWLSVERKGKGQVILFAAMPAFRGYHRATGRLFANAVVFGPGLGASQPIGW